MAAVLLLCLALVGGAAAAKCEAVEGKLGVSESFENLGDITIAVANKAPFDVTIFWVDFEGNEHYNGLIGEGDNTKLNSHNGHVFVIRSMVTHIPVVRIQADAAKDGRLIMVDVSSCDEALAAETEYDEKYGWRARSAEFEALVDFGDECAGRDSAKWSCVRKVTPEERNARDPNLYGFSKGEGGRRKDGAQEDHGYTKQQHFIPHISTGPGYLKMKHTKRMKELLYPWYEQKMATDVEDHGIISGGKLVITRRITLNWYSIYRL
jgi:hypothetical protein